MIGRLEESIPPSVAKTTLYRVAGWLLRAYVAASLLVGGYRNSRHHAAGSGRPSSAYRRVYRRVGRTTETTRT